MSTCQCVISGDERLLPSGWGSNDRSRCVVEVVSGSKDE